MKSLIRKCTACGKYTMDEKCQICGSATIGTDPLKYSPSDKFQKYRLMDKEVESDGKDNS
ncbi:Nucleolar RNA-binding protein Nop10p [mine drainage metagenome]|uniref:Ribosome biogenesis protein Nop10 n=1 Tax=mine drainage metagenome TaxID=410659 RepID=T1D9D9_9ZZZZ